MRLVHLPVIGIWESWRRAARALALAGTRPDDIDWHCGGTEPDLFGERVQPFKLTDDAATETPVPQLTAPDGFLTAAARAVHHSDAARFDLLYRLLLRLRSNRHLMTDSSDPDVARLGLLVKAVRRDAHKMKAFVRFREVGNGEEGRRQFVAWFEPSHLVVEPTAPFFARRFSDMDWLIATPKATAIFKAGHLSFGEGARRPDHADDQAEALWKTYFSSIFNPARLKVKAMTSEMPKKYWRNLPEAALIPEMIREAKLRETGMITSEIRPAAPIAAKWQAGLHRDVPERQEVPGGDRLGAARRDIALCRRCSLHECATQPVFGHGLADARIMVVGEQPGHEEDLTGQPFVGPAGRLFDDCASAAGFDRKRAYVTNAVKHFKFQPKGKLRLHQRPNAGEVEHCRWWLGLEIDAIRPELIVALGATAALALTGNGRNVLERRGTMEDANGIPVLITLHPAAVLRAPDALAQVRNRQFFIDDLSVAATLNV